jgi:hypothetical protein
MPTERKFRFPFFARNNDETVSESNDATAPQQSAPNEIHEYNTLLGTTCINTSTSQQGNSTIPYTMREIYLYSRNPMVYPEELRRISRWSYYSNGTITAAVDYLKSMHTLDAVVVCKSTKVDGSKPVRYKQNSMKMRSVLNTIHYKQIIRDAVFHDALDGMYVAYFEVKDSPPDKQLILSDTEVENIIEINANGTNAMVIPLPINYIRIIGRKNNSYEVAFNLRYFDLFTDDQRKRKLRGFPSEIQEGYTAYSTGKYLSGDSWLRLNNNNTIVTKIKSGIEEPFGVPFTIAALDDVEYAKYFINTKRTVLDSVNHQVVYETFPEGEKKGSSSLTKKQQEDQHNTVKSALLNRSNTSGLSFFSLASGTKLDNIKVDVSLLDEANENTITDAVNKDIGFSAGALNGTSSSSNYATATLNLELVASNVFTWIEDIVDEMNKCINNNIIHDQACRMEFYVPNVMFANRDKQVKYMSDLYSRGKGSLIAWIASTGFNPDTYIALMDYELEQDYENAYPIHKTSFTVSGKDAPDGDVDHSTGRPATSDNSNPSTAQTKAINGNENPKPSS